MNQNAALAAIILLVFGLAVFLAVHYTGAGAGADGVEGLSEFSVELGSSGLGGNNGYYLSAHSRIDADSTTGAINSWELQALATWGTDGNAWVIKDGVKYSGNIANGVMTVGECSSFSVAELTAEGLGGVNIAPQELLHKPDDPRYRKGMGKIYGLNFRGQSYTMHTTAEGVPKQIFGMREAFTVRAFTAGANTLALPQINQGAVVCNAVTIQSKRDINGMSSVQLALQQEKDLWTTEQQQQHKAELANKKLAAMRHKSGGNQLSSCPAGWGGDGYCDSNCNNAGDFYDGGDCCPLTCVGTIQYPTCAGATAANCLDPNGGSTTTSSGHCPAGWAGDGYCDSQCNHAGTNWDNGDCCSQSCTPGRNYACGYAGYTCLNPVHASGSKKCSFLHGAGRAGSRPAQVVTSYTGVSGPGSGSKYWGNFDAGGGNLFVDARWPESNYYTGVITCTTSYYTQGDTKNYGWDDRELQNAWYNTAKGTHVRFAHSMGNLIMAGACLDQNKCDVRWFNMAGPMRASSLADTEDRLSWLIGAADGSHASLMTTFRGFQGSQQANQIGQMVHTHSLFRGFNCGEGRVSCWFGANCAALALATGLISGEDDGLVSYDSCSRGGNSLYRYGTGNSIGATSSGTGYNNWSQRFYRSAQNHQDLTGTEGDWDDFITTIQGNTNGWVSNMVNAM